MEQQPIEETGMSVEHEYVGFWARLGASLIDTLLLLLITLPLLFAIYGEEYWESGDAIAGGADFIITYLFPLVATILFWMYKAATPGKMVLQAQIVDAKTGQPIGRSQSIIRYIGYYISSLFLGLGFLWIAWDPKKQGWHDKMAGTLVINATPNEADGLTFTDNQSS